MFCCFVFTNSKHRRDFRKRISLNILQNIDVPAGDRKQEGAQHGQLKRRFPVLASSKRGLAPRELPFGLSPSEHCRTISIVHGAVITFQTKTEFGRKTSDFRARLGGSVKLYCPFGMPVLANRPLGIHPL